MGADSTLFINISRNPGDFNYSSIDNNIPYKCATVTQGQASSNLSLAIGQPDIFYDFNNIVGGTNKLFYSKKACHLQKDTVYYINVRNEDPTVHTPAQLAAARYTNERGLNSCVDYYHTPNYVCGAVFVRRYTSLPTPSFKITNTSLSNGKVGTSYNATLTTSGLESPKWPSGMNWKIASGVLPPGINLNSNSCNESSTECSMSKRKAVITGTPTTAGTYTFTVVLSVDSIKQTSGTQTFSFAAGVVSKRFTIVVK